MKKSVLYSVAAICAFLSQSAQAQFDYSNNGNGTCTVTGYYGAAGAVNIPGAINGLAVTGIGGGAFGNINNLTGITIPNGVTFIGPDAFSGCSSLTSIAIPPSVTSIYNAAFNNCTSLASITIPSGASIGEYAFEECTGLTSITVGSAANIGDYAFVDCYSLASVYFQGNAPFADGTVFQSDGRATAYYLPGTTGWNIFSANTGIPAVVENVPASITSQPQSLIVNAHATATFSATAYGTGPLNYQWSVNGSNIFGATSSGLTIPNVAQTNLGAYAVTVSNTFSTATSSNAVLSMYPFIAVPFTGLAAYWGRDPTLSVGAWGSGPLDYQWFYNGNSIDGATNQSLTLPAIQAANAGLYSVVVSSAFGSATNPPAQVIVEPAGVALGFSPTLTINGATGYRYIIQSTTNLTDTNAWVTVTNLTLSQPVQV